MSFQKRIAGIAAAAAGLLFAAPAGAATIPVTITADTSGAADCSLREAVSSANANTNLANGCVAGQSGSVDTITLSATAGADTYTLTGNALEDANVSGDLDLTANDQGVEIRSGDTDVNGDPLDRISGGNIDRVIHVVNTTVAPLTVENVIVQDGTPPGSPTEGGAIFALGAPIEIINSQIRASIASNGGGVLSVGPLTITDSLIGDDTVAEGNSARIGGGVLAFANTTIERSTLAFNKVSLSPNAGFDSLAGGGLYVSGGTTTIIDSTIAGNQATPVQAGDGPRGAGIATDNGNLVVKGSTISGNQVIGGANGNSAGVSLGSGSAHTATFVNSTISGNTVDNTGSGTRTIGGLNAQATVTTRLIHVTVAGNVAPGTAAIQGGSHLTLKGSVIDQPEAGACLGVFTADAFNVGADANCVGPPMDSDIVSTSLAINLQALAGNGGPTQTRALGPSSTAENVVPVAACLDENDSALLVDQRGAERPFGANCDAGAYERVTCGSFIPSHLGGPGDDALTGLIGVPDSMVGSAGNDTIDGVSGNDFLCGGSGNDTLTGGAGQDQIFGETGNDTVLAQDGIADTVDCGPGTDIYTVDASLDTLVACETNTNAPPGGPPATPPATPGQAKKCKKRKAKKRAVPAAKKCKKMKRKK